jgi:hypothetical protein
MNLRWEEREIAWLDEPSLHLLRAMIAQLIVCRRAPVCGILRDGPNSWWWGRVKNHSASRCESVG